MKPLLITVVPNGTPSCNGGGHPEQISHSCRPTGNICGHDFFKEILKLWLPWPHTLWVLSAYQPNHPPPTCRQAPPPSHWSLTAVFSRGVQGGGQRVGRAAVALWCTPLHWPRIFFSPQTGNQHIYQPVGKPGKLRNGLCVTQFV